MEPLCNFCEDIAVLYCHDCNMHFCTANGCDEQIHAGKRHKKEGIQSGLTSATVPLEEEAPVCEFCELSSSEVYCEDCCMYLCTANGCLASNHKNAIGHEITSLFVEDGEFVEYVEEEQEGPSSNSRSSELTSQDGATNDIEPELSQLSIHSGGAQEDKAEKSEKSEKLPEKFPEKGSARPTIQAEPRVAASSDLPRSLISPPLTAKTASVKLVAKGNTPAPAATPREKTAATLVSNVVKRLVAPIKGTGTKEERLQRREAVLAARADVKLPPTTFGSKFAPEDSKGRRKPSLSFLKQPAAPAAPVSSKDNIKPPIPRAPSPKKKVEEPKVSPAKSTKDLGATTGGASRSPAKTTHTAARVLPPSWSVTDKNASPAAALPSSLFSASSALPSPTASTARARTSLSSPSPAPAPKAFPAPSPAPRGSLSGASPAGPRGSLSSPSPAAAPKPAPSPAAPKPAPATPAPRRASTITVDTFEYPAGLAPLGLKYANAPEAGVLVRGVTPGEAGDRAGIQLGDTVKLLNRKAVRNMEEFQSILLDCKPAVPYKIAVVRKDKSVDLKLTL